ncbi:PaaX family transcriptional regulator C-terminal domain-containing protein [Streptomyces physcomitrii]|uniref:PaaX family transcriptional regulator C-terminal domain-containing protein n=1 Tax=Streptomyces physcomitrii TaxID=2724184 RepID=UPI003442836F
MAAPPPADALGLRPLTARSVVLSLLLGSHPPEHPVRELVRIAELFDISEQTLRVALTRMVAAGDLLRAEGTYRLSDRLVQRQRRQDEAIHPRTRDWDGGWEMLAVTVTGRSAADRAALRTRLSELRLAELREGLWLRPANLDRVLPPELDDLVRKFTARPEGEPEALANGLWDLDGWARTGAALLDRLQAADRPAERFTLAAATVRHLLADPVLPTALLPPHWPAGELRAAYGDYQEELVALGRAGRAGG